ncbi:MAG: HAMP domain-containing protein [Bacteroidetes bacterium]|nr:MAG: HAMP domain-containing protein [Bacteroidota bacterium]
MNLSYKNRIALYYMLATASVMGLVFLVIYVVVHTVAYQELDNDLAYEAHKHTKEIRLANDSMLFINKLEWMEREHREVQVNPVFVQVVNVEGKLMDKSPNLKEGALVFHSEKGTDMHFDTQLNQQAIRQVQIPIVQQGELKGYILTAMSQEGTIAVLGSLKQTLCLLFPSVLVVLFFVTRLLAGRSIVPVKVITETAGRITRNNLNERIPLPKNKDELYSLTSSINELLDRIQHAMEREKQFTADASHQLRTPLAVIKGTLEVLIRKSRSPEAYESSIRSCIAEIDRISVIVNQLLILARFDQAKHQLVLREVNLLIATDEVLLRLKQAIESRQLKINLHGPQQASLISDPYYVDLILENIISNAIKYSPKGSSIDIQLTQEAGRLKYVVSDAGLGIPARDLPHIFNPFFRSGELEHPHIKGNGLGLSIVKKAAELLQTDIQVRSQPGQGTTFSLYFPPEIS